MATGGESTTLVVLTRDVRATDRPPGNHEPSAINPKW